MWLVRVGSPASMLPIAADERQGGCLESTPPVLPSALKRALGDAGALLAGLHLSGEGDVLVSWCGRSWRRRRFLACTEPIRWPCGRISATIPRPKQPHGSGLGKQRWVVERTIAWLHQYRRLRIRYERRADIHEAFLQIAGCLICLKLLNAEESFC